MRLVRVGAPGDQSPGVHTGDDRILDPGVLVHDWSRATLGPDHRVVLGPQRQELIKA